MHIKNSNLKLTPVNIDERLNWNFKAGDTVRVWTKIFDSEGKYRLQPFEGIILCRKGKKKIGANFTVRKNSFGVDVEKTFPLFSPLIEKVEIIKKAKRTRRAKLYYIREKATREIRKKMKSIIAGKDKSFEKEENLEEENTEKTSEEPLENVSLKEEEKSEKEEK